MKKLALCLGLVLGLSVYANAEDDGYDYGEELTSSAEEQTVAASALDQKKRQVAKTTDPSRNSDPVVSLNDDALAEEDWELADDGTDEEDPE